MPVYVPEAREIISGEIVYSFAERKIGKFILANGTVKNLYQKTIDCGAGPNNAIKTVAHGISNFDREVRVEGIGYSATLDRWYPIVYAGRNAATETVTVYVDRSLIHIVAGADKTTWSPIHITIFYTCTNR